MNEYHLQGNGGWRQHSRGSVSVLVLPVVLPSTVYLSLCRCIFDTAIDKKF